MSRIWLLSCCIVTMLGERGMLENPVEEATVKQKCKLQGYNVPIKVHGCVKTTILVNSCLGACLSLHCPRDDNHRDDGHHIKFENISNCCHVTKVVNVTLVLKCWNDHMSQPYFLSHLVQSAMACSCQKCRT